MAEIFPLLSICIATRNRCSDLANTLDALLAQSCPELEIVVVDGASSDDTDAVVRSRSASHSNLKYFPQPLNSGVDGDYDKTVSLARGKYCWFMSDDDLLVDGAVQRVLAACRRQPLAVLVDAEVHTADMSQMILGHRFPFTGERLYEAGQSERLMMECGEALSFIGSLIISRQFWLERERQRYWGTEFVHVGVMFQDSLPGAVLALGEPLLKIRYGVGNWAARAFEVWMFKWPALIWSFSHIPDCARHVVTPQTPWKNVVKLMLYRAKGLYNLDLFRRFVAPAKRPLTDKIPAFLVAMFPGRWAYLMLKAILALRPTKHHAARWELGLSPYASSK